MAFVKGTARFRALFLFPGAPVYLSDQDDVGVVAEKRILDWGAADLLLDAGEDTLTLVVSNRLIPDAPGGLRFSDRWALTKPPHGVGVVVEASMSAGAPDWSIFFVGGIREVSELTERSVTLQIGTASSSYFRTIGTPILRTEFPQAAAEVLDGLVKPIILGKFGGFVPPLVRRRQRATLTSALLATTPAPFDLGVDTNANWPDVGTLEIGDELFTYDQTTVTEDDVLRITARATGGTSAAAHAIGDVAAEVAKARWLVADHPSKEITAVYGVSPDGEKITLDPSLYDVHLGDSEDPRTWVRLTSSKGLTVGVPSKTPSYRRVEMDAAGSLAEHAAAAIAGVSTGSRAKNPAMAAGESAQWGPSNFAVLARDVHDTLVVKRSAPVPDPGTPASQVRIGVEHFGLQEFGTHAILSAEILATDSQIVVDDAAGLIAAGAVFLLIDSELLQVISFVDDQAITVARGALGTAPVSHGEGERVFAALNGSFQALFPNVQVRIEDANGVLQPLGGLTDETAVPPVLTQDAGAYTDVKTITAFHGHEVDGGVIAAGLYLTAGFDVSGDSFEFLGALYVSTLLPDSSGDPNIAYPLSSEITKAYALGSEGVSFVMPAAVGSLPGAMKQKIKALRVRFAHAAGNGQSSSSVRVRLWLGDDKVLDEVKSSKGEVAKGNPPDIDSVLADLSGYPDGVDLQKLFHRNTLLHFEEVSNGTRLFFVGIDVVFDEQQLIGSSVDFANDRTILSGSFDLVLQHAGTYDSGLGGSGADHVLELYDGRSFFFLTVDTGVSHKIRDNGSKAGVQFTSNPSAAADTQTVGCYWSGIDAPSGARVKRLTVLMDVAFHADDVVPPTVFLRDHANGVTYVATQESTGGVTKFDGQTYTRRCWRITWNASDLSLQNGKVLTVRRLMRDFHVRISANGSGTGEFYCFSIDYFLEVDQATTALTKSQDPDAFTRIRYFDVSQYVATWAELEGRKIVVSLENASISDDDAAKPLLLARVFALFTYTPSTDAELERIAVDGTGIELADGLDAIRKVLTAGYPLLAIPPVVLNEASFATAIASGSLPLRGVIERQIEPEDLLADLAEQARVSFLWEGGFASVIFKPDLDALPAVAFVFSHSAGDVLQDSVTVSYRTRETVGNVVTVRGGRDFVRGGYELSAETDNADSIATWGRRPFAVDADFLHDETDLANLACQLLNYRREMETIVRWESPPTVKARSVKRGMILQLAAPPVGSLDRLEVLGVRTVVGGVAQGISRIEITTVQRPPAVPCPNIVVPDFGDDDGGGDTGNDSAFTSDFDGDFD